MAEGSADQAQGSEQAHEPAEDAVVLAASAPAPELPTQPAGAPALEPIKPIPFTQPANSRAQQSTGGWWTLPTMCIGIGLIACAMIVGQVEENRQLAWQRNKLEMDLKYLQEQADTNKEFLERLKTDANLVERLAQRQMRMVREGAAVLELEGSPDEQTSSAFKLVRTPPPPEVEPYQPASTLLSRLFGDARRRLYASGLGALMVALGLIMGGKPKGE